MVWYAKSGSGTIKGIGLFSKRPVLFDWYKVLANMLAPVELRAQEKAITLDKATNSIRLVKLEGSKTSIRKSSPADCSSGYIIARALILDPEILFMTNPSEPWMP